MKKSNISEILCDTDIEIMNGLLDSVNNDISTKLHQLFSIFNKHDSNFNYVKKYYAKNTLNDIGVRVRKSRLQQQIIYVVRKVKNTEAKQYGKCETSPKINEKISKKYFQSDQIVQLPQSILKFTSCKSHSSALNSQSNSKSQSRSQSRNKDKKVQFQLDDDENKEKSNLSCRVKNLKRQSIKISFRLSTIMKNQKSFESISSGHQSIN